MCGTVGILIKATETNQVVIAEQFNLFTYFFHQNIFRGEGMNGEDLVISKLMAG